MAQGIKTLAALLAAGIAGTALAAATPEEIKSLSGARTPWGAEVAGNKDGSIPAWTGAVNPPAGFDPQKPMRRPDPFANEKALFSIDAKNMDKYADKLSDGTKAMLKKYPTYRLDIYPGHRTANYPKFYLDNTLKNASACKTGSDGLKLEGCWPGLPFPFPKTGNEVVWNRLLKFDAPAMTTTAMSSRVVDTQGNITLTGASTAYIQYPIFDPKRTTPISDNEIYEALRLDYSAPNRKAGEKVLVRDSVDMLDTGRRAWSYLPGQRRVKLSPDLSYDTPSPTGGGTGVLDDTAVFFGAMDRYDFKLVGKKEMYIPYNSYKIRDPQVCPENVRHMKNHLNPDCMRWELHRVWVVEATLKPGKRHVYPKRVFHFDEDMPGVGIADNYDSTGQIYRVVLNLPISLYETPGHHATDEYVTHDLATGMYAHQTDPTDGGGWVVTPLKPNSFFMPEALAAEGVR
ncbi:MAG TPA: DUF1329 domain-containing protein [Aromatoleum sp.]|uniref:DUF1329 domain-containing protein n=1 Tax=Aromatoleum sp. TaxID=2307007 RepID=UPI002B47C8EC|nr:DUF1329 domain-containing protein [Aromatoleum sp.]HJV26468.1 DUF1329 domain-containing protein [Aromatoleum sp.]